MHATHKFDVNCIYGHAIGTAHPNHKVMNRKQLQRKRLLKILIKVIIILAIVAEIVYLIKCPISSRDDFHLHV